MNSTLAPLQWDKSLVNARAKGLRGAGWIVFVESNDGGRGGSNVLKQQPTAVVMDSVKCPSHSREIAGGLRGYNPGHDIPMVFVVPAEEGRVETKAEVPHCTLATTYTVIATRRTL